MEDNILVVTWNTGNSLTHENFKNFMSKIADENTQEANLIIIGFQELGNIYNKIKLWFEDTVSRAPFNIYKILDSTKHPYHLQTTTNEFILKTFVLV